jgi:hypothetical protein
MEIGMQQLQQMNPETLMFVIAGIVVVLILAFVLFRNFGHNHGKRDFAGHYGEEYQRLVAETGSSEKADERLVARERRVADYHLHAMDKAAQEGFVAQWKAAQASFIDDPKASLAQAGEVLDKLLSEQGYPNADFDRRSADLSVNHPAVVKDFRVAHEIALKNKEGKTTTEDLRQAMIHYRAIFTTLMAGPNLRTAA